MAKRIEKPQQDEDHQDDLEVLNPERELTIQGEVITVREYGFVEGLKIRPIAQPFIESLNQVFKAGDLSTEAVLMAVGEHVDAVLQLVAISADVELEWVHQLGDSDGQNLLMTWWGVNGPFFVRALQTRAITELMEAQRKANRHSDGPTSTPTSSTAAMTSTESDATPNDN
ncbi:DUF6631 family protein [Marinobacterium stanieri]|uniref:Uncharacterized protein n=1 Tax=Marinobacterium stanieri TaxID=49186 RepID=A0A1N6RPZ8_9GAMM|nr:DUF6631 family protein [Marinobacterium stanieri]SIQ30950.1 hypothetical protein SAMN05421647_103461 [Marinobacterium stanieri]